MLTLPARLLDRISPCPTTGCWFWDGRVNRNGYAYARWFGPEQVVHRVIWVLLVAPICWWLELDHKCRIRCCVNPDHLAPVPPVVNTHRGLAVLYRRAA